MWWTSTINTIVWVISTLSNAYNLDYSTQGFYVRNSQRALKIGLSLYELKQGGGPKILEYSTNVIASTLMLGAVGGLGSVAVKAVANTSVKLSDLSMFANNLRNITLDSYRGAQVELMSVGGVRGVVGKAVGKVGVGAEDSERFTQIFSGISKTEARQILRSGDHPLTVEQTQKVLGYFKKGRADRINLKVSNTTGEVRLSSERSGRVSGYQRMTYGIDTEGNTNKVVQTAFDDHNNLVRQSPGAPKNNLYDVKKWW